MSKTDSEITFDQYFRSLFSYRVAILLFVFFVTSAVIVISLLMKPVYRADILVAPQSSSSSLRGIAQFAGQLGGLASLAGIGDASDQNANESIAILRSRAFTEKFILEEGVIPVLYERLWDSDQGSWMSDIGDVPTIEDAYIKFNESVRRIDRNLKTGHIRVSVDWTDRKVAAEWANLLVDRLNDHIRRRDMDAARRSIEYLNEQLELSRNVELQKGIASLIESQIEKIMLAEVQEDYAFRILDPAVVPDSDNRVRPKRTLMVVVAFTMSWFVAMFLVLVHLTWRNWVID